MSVDQGSREVVLTEMLNKDERDVYTWPGQPNDRALRGTGAKLLNGRCSRDSVVNETEIDAIEQIADWVWVTRRPA